MTQKADYAIDGGLLAACISFSLDAFGHTSVLGIGDLMIGAGVGAWVGHLLDTRSTPTAASVYRREEWRKTIRHGLLVFLATLAITGLAIMILAMDVEARPGDFKWNPLIAVIAACIDIVRKRPGYEERQAARVRAKAVAEATPRSKAATRWILVLRLLLLSAGIAAIYAVASVAPVNDPMEPNAMFPYERWPHANEVRWRLAWAVPVGGILTWVASGQLFPPRPARRQP